MTDQVVSTLTPGPRGGPPRSLSPRGNAGVKPVGRVLVLPLAIFTCLEVLIRSLTLEESEDPGLIIDEEPAERVYVQNLDDNEKAYLNVISGAISSYNRNARFRLRRFYMMSALTITAGASVPVAVAASAPGWVPAGLGGVAAVSHGIQQLLQDQRLGIESHAMAVSLNECVRKMQYDIGAGAVGRQAVFEDFVRNVELRLETGGAKLLHAMRSGFASDAK